MDITWIELHPESRNFEISRNSISKDFVFVITCDEPYDFVNNATTEYLPNTSLILYNDDAVVQEQISAIFWQQIPIFFEFVVDDGYSVLLWISSLKATQLTWDQWKVECTFDVPSDNGANQGGTNSNDPNDEKHSDNYTQISFNAEVSQEKRQMGRIKEIHKGLNRPSAELVASGKLVDTRQLVGITDDGIEGYDCNIRTFRFSLVQYMKPTKLTYAYVRRLARLVTALNDYPFFGFPRLSVMCVGADGSGSIFQSVPVRLDFEYRPNFKFSRTIPTRTIDGITETGTPNLLPPIVDSYSGYDVHGTQTLYLVPQYAIIYEPEFPTTTIINTEMDIGVHSGWSIITYDYISNVEPNVPKPIKIPSIRTIYLPDEYVPIDFNYFLL